MTDCEKVGLEVVDEVYVQKRHYFSEPGHVRKDVLFKIVILGLVSTNLLDIF